MASQFTYPRTCGLSRLSYGFVLAKIPRITKLNDYRLKARFKIDFLKIYYFIIFTMQNFHLLELLAEVFRCHVHHFQCLAVPVL